MKKWLRLQLLKFINGPEKQPAEGVPLHYNGSNSISIDWDESNDSISFDVSFATGGIVIKTRRSALSKGNTRGMYVIHSDQDLAHELAKIITLESLKKG